MKNKLHLRRKIAKRQLTQIGIARQRRFSSRSCNSTQRDCAEHVSAVPFVNQMANVSRKIGVTLASIAERTEHGSKFEHHIGVKENGATFARFQALAKKTGQSPGKVARVLFRIGLLSAEQALESGLLR